MTSIPPVESVSGAIERSVSIRHVFGEPVSHGDVTVIPVAQVIVAFGGGGGTALEYPGPSTGGGLAVGGKGHGSGGGGVVRMTPLGVVEITGAGARFVRCHSLAPLVVAAALGFAVASLIFRRSPE